MSSSTGPSAAMFLFGATIFITVVVLIIIEALRRKKK